MHTELVPRSTHSRRYLYSFEQSLPRSTQCFKRALCMSQSSALQAGARVRVVKSLIVYHIPKVKEGMDIEGLEGTVIQDVRHKDGKELSPNYPWKVQFQRTSPNGQKQSKFFVHLDEEEIEIMEEEI